MKFTFSILLAILALGCALFGQSVVLETQPQTFHIKGTITDSTNAVIPGTKVTLQNEQLNKVVNTDSAGIYEAELPLGSYTMTAQVRGFRLYRRPLFRVEAPASLTFDATLTVASTCDLVVVPPMPENLVAAEKEFCVHEDFSPVPSKDGVQYQLYVRYGRRHPLQYPGEGRVFVAYNLFSLQADSVTYDEKDRTIKAHGNVVVADEFGATQRADTMSFKIEDGRATPLR